jgi:hypothetical protein
MSNSRRSNRIVLIAVATGLVFFLWHMTGHEGVAGVSRSFAEMGERGFLVRVCPPPFQRACPTLMK